MGIPGREAAVKCNKIYIMNDTSILEDTRRRL
jgi:hypothetical protein